MVALSRKTLRLHLRRDWFVESAPGAYVDAGTPDTLQLRLAALALVLPPGAVACRSTAAWIHGIDALPSGSHQREPTLQIAVREGTTAVRRRGITSYVEQLDPGDVVRLGDVEVTSALRTATDLGRWLRRERRDRSVGRLPASGLVTRTQLRAATDRWFTYAGVKQPGSCVEFAVGARSRHVESWLRLALHDAGFPATNFKSRCRAAGLEAVPSRPRLRRADGRGGVRRGRMAPARAHRSGRRPPHVPPTTWLDGDRRPTRGPRAPRPACRGRRDVRVTPVRLPRRGAKAA